MNGPLALRVFLFHFQTEEGKIPGQRSMNSMIITWKFIQFTTFFTSDKVSLIHENLRYSQNCKISSRLIRQLTCSTGIEGKHSRTKLQKNHALSSVLKNRGQFFLKCLTSLTNLLASKAALNFLELKFFTIFFLLLDNLQNFWWCRQ